MFLRYAAGPPAGKVAVERFGLAGALERAAAAFTDQGVQLGKAVFFALPPEILAPRARRDGGFHARSISACSSPPPPRAGGL